MSTHSERQLTERRVELASAAETEALGAALGPLLRAGDAVGLVGELGAGKTCCARGLARGLAVHEPDAVQSPTYLLVVEHDGPLPMLHLDAYLPAKLRRFLADGGVDYLAERGAVVVAEWADRIADLLPERTLWIELRPTRCGGRIATIRAPVGAFPGLATIPFADEPPRTELR